MATRKEEFPPTAKEAAVQQFEAHMARQEAAAVRERSGFWDALQRQHDAQRVERLLQKRAELGRDPTPGEELHMRMQLSGTPEGRKAARDGFLAEWARTGTLTDSMLDANANARAWLVRAIAGGPALFSGDGSTMIDPPRAPARPTVLLRVLASKCPDCGGAAHTDPAVVRCGGSRKDAAHAIRVKTGLKPGNAKFIEMLDRAGAELNVFTTLEPNPAGVVEVPIGVALTALNLHSAVGHPPTRRFRERAGRLGDRWLVSEVR